MTDTSQDVGVWGGAGKEMVLVLSSSEIRFRSWHDFHSAESSPSQGLFSTFDVCVSFFLSLCLSNLIICFELYCAKASLCWLSRQMRQQAGGRIGWWGVWRQTHLALFFICSEKRSEEKYFFGFCSLASL